MRESGRRMCIGRLLRHGCGLVLGFSLLTGCVESAAPILADARPLLGEHVRLHLYGLHDGKAHDFQKVAFRWNGKRYVSVGRNHSGIDSFTLHPFAGDDWIAQSAHTWRGVTTIEYALVRHLAEGVHLVIPIDEDDADEATRARMCQRSPQFACRIDSVAQLMSLARATAAKPHAAGGLAVQIADP